MLPVNLPATELSPADKNSTYKASTPLVSNYAGRHDPENNTLNANELRTKSEDAKGPAISPPLPAQPPSTQEPGPDTPPQPPRKKTAPSPNTLGGMFSRKLNKWQVISVVEDVLCSARVTNNRRKSAKILEAIDNGCTDGETMEWLIKGFRSPRAKRELAQRHAGLEFSGPKWGTPMYRTAKGMARLLQGVSVDAMHMKQSQPVLHWTLPYCRSSTTPYPAAVVLLLLCSGFHAPSSRRPAFKSVTTLQPSTVLMLLQRPPHGHIPVIWFTPR